MYICNIYSYPDISQIVNYLILEESLTEYPQKEIIDECYIICLKYSWLLECDKQKHFIIPNQSFIWKPKSRIITKSCIFYNYNSYICNKIILFIKFIKEIRRNNSVNSIKWWYYYSFFIICKLYYM